MVNVEYRIKDMVDIAKSRTEEENKDSITFVSGSRGDGKSTYSFKFCSRFDAFNPNKHIVYLRKDVQALMELKNQVIMDDEAIRTGYKRKFYEPDQISLIETFNMNRYHNNVYMGCIPTFIDLDLSLRKLCTMWINIIRKGVGIVNVPTENPFSTDKWNIDTNLKIVLGALKRQKKDPNYEIPWHKLTTFAGYIYFNKMTDNQERLYEEIREKKRREAKEREEEDGKGDNQKKQGVYDKIIELLDRGVMTHDKLKELAYINGIEYHSLNHRLNCMIKKKWFGKTLKDFIGDAREKDDTPIPFNR